MGVKDSGVDVNMDPHTAQEMGLREAEWELLVSRLEGTWGRKAPCWMSPGILCFSKAASLASLPLGLKVQRKGHQC